MLSLGVLTELLAGWSNSVVIISNALNLHFLASESDRNWSDADTISKWLYHSSEWSYGKRKSKGSLWDQVNLGCNKNLVYLIQTTRQHSIKVIQNFKLTPIAYYVIIFWTSIFGCMNMKKPKGFRFTHPNNISIFQQPQSCKKYVDPNHKTPEYCSMKWYSILWKFSILILLRTEKLWIFRMSFSYILPIIKIYTNKCLHVTVWWWWCNRQVNKRNP